MVLVWLWCAVRITTECRTAVPLLEMRFGLYLHIVSRMFSCTRLLAWPTRCSPCAHMQVVAKGDGGEEAANRIVRQCALLRATHPLLALPSSTGSMSVDGTMTDWALRAVRWQA